VAPNHQQSNWAKRNAEPGYWLTPSEDEQFDCKVNDICQLYQQAPALAQQGERVVSAGELTAVQTLERKHPGLPLTPGKVERREFEYIIRCSMTRPFKWTFQGRPLVA
jgi:hypothetical protein